MRSEAAKPKRPGRSGRINADEAARRLGVRRETVYAYVSRGLIRSEAQGGTRERLYHREDVEALVRRRQGRRDPARAAADALSWGAPVLESELTLIRDGELYYRGEPAETLAASSTFEDVAGLLWGRLPEAGIPDALPSLPRSWTRWSALLAGLPPLERFQVALAATGAGDAGAYDTSPAAVHRTGAAVLRLLAGVAIGAEPSRAPIAELLQRGWVPKQPRTRAAIEAALILWADHELNVGTFTVRCVASAHATPYAAVSAGLSALRGGLHGGATERVEALFDEAQSPPRVRAALEARLRRGERIPGFGHHLYPDGDPRANALLAHVRSLRPKARALALADSIERESVALIGHRPNIDFASVSLRRVFDLPLGSTLALVAVGRCAGWIAHVLEQYRAGRLIRPRARYVGPPPRDE